MLRIQYLKFQYITHVKSGFYIDYLWRLVGKHNLLNLFIWGSLYVSEKFIIEYTTRFMTNNTNIKSTLIKNPTNIVFVTITWIVLLGIIIMLI